MKLLCRRCVLDDLMYRPVLLPPRRDYEYPLLNRRVQTSPGSRERGSTAGGGELSNRKCCARMRRRLDNWSWTQASSIAHTHNTPIQTKCLPESPGLEPLPLGHKSSALVGTAVDLAPNQKYFIATLFEPDIRFTA